MADDGNNHTRHEVFMDFRDEFCCEPGKFTIQVGSKDEYYMSRMPTVYVGSIEGNYSLLDGVAKHISEDASLFHISLYHVKIFKYTREHIVSLLFQNPNVRIVSFCSVIYHKPSFPVAYNRLSYAILKGLDNNKTVTCLDFTSMSRNEFSAMDLANFITTDSALSCLNLSDNLLNDSDCEIIASALEKNKKIRTLKMSNNEITTVGAKRIIDAACSNGILKTIDLRYNHIIYTEELAIKKYVATQSPDLVIMF
jgi:hypothetical protein